MTEPIRAPRKAWDAVYHAAAQLDPLSCCLVELRDRVVALEAAGSVAGNSGHAPAAPVTTADGLSPVEPTPAAEAPTGVTVEEMVACLPKKWNGSFEAFARHLLDHPRLGPLLRGEGAPTPKRVVLPEEPPEVNTPLYWNSFVSDYGLAWQEGHAAGWAAARAEVERQQQGGQADG